jgi:hypothetical protein
MGTGSLSRLHGGNAEPRHIGKKIAPTCGRGQSPIARPQSDRAQGMSRISQMGMGSLLPVHGTLPAAVRHRIDISKPTEPPAGAARLKILMRPPL